VVECTLNTDLAFFLDQLSCSLWQHMQRGRALSPIDADLPFRVHGAQLEGETDLTYRLPARLVRWLVVCWFCVSILSIGAYAATPISAPYWSYTYDFWISWVPSPPAYLPDTVYDGATLGVGALNGPQDIFVAPDGRVYIADTGNSRVICLDSNYKLIRVITEFFDGSTTSRFNKPEGLFVTDQGELYVADTGNGRVVVLDEDGNFLRVIGPPTETDETEGLLIENFVYRPQKVTVTSSRHMYVVARDVYDGLMKFNSGGQFAGYIGAPRVRPTLWERIWTRLGTEEQRERRALFLPIEYASIDVDQKGLILAVQPGVVEKKKENIKRLNPAGEDVLVRAGHHHPLGDYVDANTSLSQFVDIAAREAGTYSVLDTKYGRIFTYDSLGNLLYAFGGLGDTAGLFRNPVAIDSSGLDIVVLDSSGFFTVFKPTEYGKLITSALLLYNQGLYDESSDIWRQILKYNANYDMAYSGIGRSLLRQGSYKAAMTYYNLGQDRSGYSDAYAMYRETMIQEQGGRFMSILLIVLVALYLFSRSRAYAAVKQVAAAKVTAAASSFNAAISDVEGAPPKRSLGVRLGRWAAQTWRALKYAFHLLAHPGEGYWELKYEKKGTMSAAWIIVILVIFTMIFQRQNTGFIFNRNNLDRINLVMEALSVLVPLLLWCGVNWALTTLMEGKGTFKDIFIASAYSLVPVILVYVPLTVISNYLRAEESGIYYLCISLGLGWSAIMLFVGTMITHEYSVAKTAVTCVLIIAGVAVVLFIGLLFSTVINHMIAFIISIYSELTLR
jgi:tetratricopeptide (TPR) repeat protein